MFKRGVAECNKNIICAQRARVSELPQPKPRAKFQVILRKVRGEGCCVYPCSVFPIINVGKHFRGNSILKLHACCIIISANGTKGT